MTQFNAGPLTGYTWGAVAAAATAAGLLLMGRTGKKRGLKAGTVPVFGALAVLLCVLGGRAGYYLLNLNRMSVIGISFFNLKRGGMMLYGALAGGLLAAFLAGKITKTPFAKIADCAAAPTALTIAAGRFAEYLTGAGYGYSIYDWFDVDNTFGRSFIAWEEPDILCRFPFAIQDSYDDWRFAINLLEGIAAIVFLVVLLRMKPRKKGGAAVLLMMMYAACQIILESMREDEVLMINYMKVSQLLSALVLLGALVICLKKAKESAGGTVASLAVLLAMAGIATAMEFALERKIGFLDWMRGDLCYLVMALCSAVMFITVYRIWKKAYPMNS